MSRHGTIREVRKGATGQDREGRNAARGSAMVARPDTRTLIRRGVYPVAKGTPTCSGKGLARFAYERARFGVRENGCEAIL